MKKRAPERQMGVLPKSGVGRAELLRGLWLAEQSRQSESGLAFAAGYTRIPVAPDHDNDVDGKAPGGMPAAQAMETGADRSHKPASREVLRARFWAVTERIPLAVGSSDAADQDGEFRPLELTDWKEIPDCPKPARQSIAPPARLMPALKRSVHAQRSGALDIEQLVTLLADGKTLRRLPRRALTGWTDRLLVVLDLSVPLLPYHGDMHQLARDLQRWVGRGNAQVRVIADEGNPFGPWTEWNFDLPYAQRGRRTWSRDWAGAATASKVLLVSELGLMARDNGRSAEAWADWLRARRTQGADIQVWCPLPIGLPGAATQAGAGWQRAAATMPRVPVVHWSAAGRLRQRPLPMADLHRTPERLLLAEQLRTRLATVARVEPGLLRALRLGMAPQAIDAGIEQLAWDHPDMSRAHRARALTGTSLQTYRDSFAQLPSAQKLSVFDTTLAHHTPVNPLLAHVETLAWAAYATPEEHAARQAQIAHARDVMHRFARDPWQLTDVARPEVQEFIARHLRDADVQTRTASSPYMCRLHVALHRERHGDLPLTESLEGLAAADMAKALGTDASTHPYWLTLDAEHGWLMLSHEKPPANLLLDPRAVETSGALSIQMGDHARWAERKPPRDIALARLPGGAEERIVDGYYKYFFAPFPPPLIDGPICVDTGFEKIRIEEIVKPVWALEWARDRQGVYALAPNLWGAPVRVPYPRPADALEQCLFQMTEFKAQGGRSVDAVALDIDCIGLMATLTLGAGLTQVFRYVPPGQFLIGSPDTEAERFSDEGPQHMVTISEGLWLADTACTQALWQAVMDDNPSHFHQGNQGGSEHPVEQVSWDDVQKFLFAVDELLPACRATLPTEAEWEYACRAGTSTPFSFGATITPKQVNYDGNFPYKKGEKGESRGRTVAVKSLPANPWGLYEMHGNVWEWCADGVREYTIEDKTDPGLDDAMNRDASGGVARALRGGGWFLEAGGARSAQRDDDPPATRSVNAGFRFALRPGSQAQQLIVSPAAILSTGTFGVPRIEIKVRDQFINKTERNARTPAKGVGASLHYVDIEKNKK